MKKYVHPETLQPEERLPEYRVAHDLLNWDSAWTFTAIQQQQTSLRTCLVMELYGFIHMGSPTYCPWAKLMPTIM